MMHINATRDDGFEHFTNDAPRQALPTFITTINGRNTAVKEVSGLGVVTHEIGEGADAAETICIITYDSSTPIAMLHALSPDAARSIARKLDELAARLESRAMAAADDLIARARKGGA